MGLEEDIKQKKWSSEYQKMMVNLMYTSSWLNQKKRDFFKLYKITPQQYNILRILRGQHPKPATVRLLIERMLDKMSNASRLVEKLRTKGLVERKECEMDRRRVDVFITKGGLKLLHEIDKKVVALEELVAHISQEEAQELNRILDKLRK